MRHLPAPLAYLCGSWVRLERARGSEVGHIICGGGGCVAHKAGGHGGVSLWLPCVVAAAALSIAYYRFPLLRGGRLARKLAMSTVVE